MEAKNFLDVAQSSQGHPYGPKLLGSVEVPYGMGLVFLDASGNKWQLRLAQNADGTTYLGDDGKPTIEIIQVNP